jgi:hypothetical protein
MASTFSCVKTEKMGRINRARRMNINVFILTPLWFLNG